MEDSEVMRIARKWARAGAEKGEVPVGALVLREEEILAEAHNSRETECDPTGHAEINALREAARKLKSWRLSGCRLFVTLEPCPMCLAAAQQARVDEVIYGTPDPKGGALSLGYKLNEDNRINHRFSVQNHPDPESAKMLSEFFKARRG